MFVCQQFKISELYFVFLLLNLSLQTLLSVFQQESIDLMKNPIVKIQLTSRNDIRINWNFNGMLMPKIFRRHVFVCASDSDQILKRTRIVMEKCYQIFKNGDLYAMASLNSSSLEWYQKSKLGKHQFSNFASKNRYSCLKKGLVTLESLMSTLSKFRQPTLVFINIDQSTNTSQLEFLIKNLREKLQLNCVFMICSPKHKQNHIQFSKGLCYLVDDQDQIFAFYKYYDEHLACIEAEITLQSLSGNVFMNNDIWKPLQFSIFRRKIYYPLSSSLCDAIQTYRLCSDDVKTWKFKFALKYKLLNGEIYGSCKQIQVPLIPDIEKTVTCINTQYKSKKFELSWGIELGSNPLEKKFILEPGV